jgi:hypothetical protein
VVGQRCLVAGDGSSDPRRQGVFEDLAELLRKI